jgi:uncharacterized protein YdcH (DUF465 family)
MGDAAGLAAGFGCGVIGAVLFGVGLHGILNRITKENHERSEASGTSIGEITKALSEMEQRSSQRHDSMMEVQREQYQAYTERMTQAISGQEKLLEELSLLRKLEVEIRDFSRSAPDILTSVNRVCTDLAEMESAASKRYDTNCKMLNEFRTAIGDRIDAQDKQFTKFTEDMGQWNSTWKTAVQNEEEFQSLLVKEISTIDRLLVEIKDLNQSGPEIMGENMEQSGEKIIRELRQEIRRVAEALEEEQDSLASNLDTIKASCENSASDFQNIMEKYSKVTEQDVALINSLLGEKNGK